MEKPKKDPLDPQRSFEVRDPKLPVIRAEAPHNRAEDHLNPGPTQEIQIL